MYDNRGDDVDGLLAKGAPIAEDGPGSSKFSADVLLKTCSLTEFEMYRIF